MYRQIHTHLCVRHRVQTGILLNVNGKATVWRHTPCFFITKLTFLGPYFGSQEHFFELGQDTHWLQKGTYIDATHTCFSNPFQDFFFVSGRPSSCCGHLELKIILCVSRISRPRLSSSFVVVVVLGRVLRFISGCRRRRNSSSVLLFVACYSRLFFVLVVGLD